MGRYENGSRETFNTSAQSKGEGRYTPTQSFFFARLERLLGLREEYDALLRPEDWENTLLHKAIYSTYCDCVQLGVGQEAKDCLAQRRKQPELPEGN
jgi:hypothetical protein